MTTQHKNKLFGEHLKTWREYAGVDQKVVMSAIAQRLDELREAGEYFENKKMNREDISRWENNERIPYRDKKLIAVIAHVLAELVRTSGYKADGDEYYRQLIIALEPQTSVDYVSWQAAQLDGLMRHFPEADRAHKWNVIYSWMKAELDVLREEESQEYVTKIRHMKRK